MDSDSNSALGRSGYVAAAKKRINDGTSDIEIRKASTSEVNRVLEGQVEITPRVTLSTET